MRKNAAKSVCKFLIVLAMFSVQARAQLSTYVSDRGTLVFTNADLPAPKAAPKVKPASPAPAPAPAKPPAAPVAAPAPPASAPAKAAVAFQATPISQAASPLT